MNTGLKFVPKTMRFEQGDYAIAKTNKVNSKTKKPDLNVVEIIRFDKTFDAYKVLEPNGKENWYNPSRLQITDNDPIVAKSYYEILSLRDQVQQLNNKFDSYKNRSFFTRLKEFFTGSK